MQYNADIGLFTRPSMLKLQEQIVISASPETVFGVITNFGAYKEWNPWIVEADGTAEEGRLVHIKARMGNRIIRVRHRILTIKPHTEFRWCDVGWFTVFSYGERARFIEPFENGHVTYRVDLTITGAAQWLVRLQYGRYLQAGLKDETRALKDQAEKSGG